MYRGTTIHLSRQIVVLMMFKLVVHRIQYQMFYILYFLIGTPLNVDNEDGASTSRETVIRQFQAYWSLLCNKKQCSQQECAAQRFRSPPREQTAMSFMACRWAGTGSDSVHVNVFTVPTAV